MRLIAPSEALVVPFVRLMRWLGFRALRLAAAAASRLDLLTSVGPAAAMRHRQASARMLADPPRAGVIHAIWSGAAAQIDAETERWGVDGLTVHLGSRSTRLRGHVTSLDAQATLDLALDRVAVHRALSERGIAVPEFVEFDAWDPRPALSAIRSRPGPFVIKPAGGTGMGAGITCAVSRPLDLLRATLNAARYGHRLIIEHQAAGGMYRLMFLDGELLEMVRRRPPQVTGDGRCTVAELIAAENSRRIGADGWAGFALLRPDLDCLLTLREQGLSLRSVPPAAATVVVKTSTSDNASEQNEIVKTSTGAGAVADASKAIAPLGLRLAGVDIVTSDIERPLAATGGVVIEVNGTPGLQYHYLVANPEDSAQVAVPILRRLLEEPRTGSSATRSRPG